MFHGFPQNCKLVVSHDITTVEPVGSSLFFGGVAQNLWAKIEPSHNHEERHNMIQ